jgi:hypothetical protein
VAQSDGPDARHSIGLVSLDRVWREKLLALSPDLLFREPAAHEQIEELEQALSR